MIGTVRGVHKLKQPIVIYEDYNCIWAQLTSLYWSTSSSFLVSRHPLSCIEEVISHYCPQCMTRYLEDEANVYKNRCPSCFQCPECESVIVPSLSETKKDSNGKPYLELLCRYEKCSWRSSLDKIHDKSDFELAVMENERQNIGIDVFKETLFMHEKNQLKLEYSNLIREAILQNKQLGDAGNSMTQLPNRVCLRTKRTVRCRKDFEQGKLSILLQPKVLPLEGDSSMKVYRGKWWVKDSSAVQFVPAVVIHKVPAITELCLAPSNASDTTTLAQEVVPRIEITIINPRDCPMKVTLTDNSINSTQNKIDNSNNSLNNKDGTSTIQYENTLHAPFSIPTIFLQTCPPPCNTNHYLFETVIGAYEDELLRDDDDADQDDEALIKTAFHNQLQEQMTSTHNNNDDINKSQNIWLVYSKYNYVRISIPIQPVIVSSSNSSKDPIISIEEKRSDVIYQLPLLMTFATVPSQDTVSESKNSASHFSNLRIAFPNQV